MILWVVDCDLSSEDSSYDDLDMYRVKFKYDFDNPNCIINGDGMENGLVSADYVLEDKPFTW